MLALKGNKKNKKEPKPLQSEGPAKLQESEKRHTSPVNKSMQGFSHSASDANSKMIVFDHVTLKYKNKNRTNVALDDVSFDVNTGEFVFLVGHSGSGKSSIIRSIIRELLPSQGTVTVGGYNTSTLRKSQIPYYRRNIGCVFQDFKVLSNKTVYENISYAMECVGKSKKEIEIQVPQVIELVGLKGKDSEYPSNISGGEVQRVAIARAIINRPPVLVCDEPTGNLDPQTTRGIMELINTINVSTKTTILVATHDIPMVRDMDKRIIRLDGGHIVRDTGTQQP